MLCYPLHIKYGLFSLPYWNISVFILVWAQTPREKEKKERRRNGAVLGSLAPLFHVVRLR